MTILGPLPCIVCRRAVVWDGLGWLFAGTMLVHDRRTCAGPPRTRAVILAER